MTALLFDVGNTRMKWGVLTGDVVSDTQSLPLHKLRDTGLSALISQLPSGIDRILISNVAGATMGTRLRGALTAQFNVPLQFAKSEAEGFGLTNAYPEPRRLGVDRWVAMVGAWAEFGTDCLVVDAGTAVTIDGINGKGKHLGGQILPGPRLMLHALHTHTGDLPDLSDDAGVAPNAKESFASETAVAMRHGAWSALHGTIERGMAHPGFKSEPTLVLTGGDAPSMLDVLGKHTEHRPHLVLEGLATMLGNSR